MEQHLNPTLANAHRVREIWTQANQTAHMFTNTLVAQSDNMTLAATIAASADTQCAVWAEMVAEEKRENAMNTDPVVHYTQEELSRATQRVLCAREVLSPMLVKAGRMAFAQRVTPPKIKAYEPVRKDRFQTSPVINLIKNLMNVLNGSKTGQFAIIKGEQVVAIGTYHYRTRTGGVNRANIQLDPACSETAPFMFSYLLASVQSASPGRRLEIQLQNWQPALLRAAKAIGCKERFSYQHMAMRFS